MNKSPVVEAAELQEAYQELIQTRSLTKRAMCDLCIPFRDKYHLTDVQTLQIARKEVTLTELVSMLGVT